MCEERRMKRKNSFDAEEEFFSTNKIFLFHLSANIQTKFQLLLIPSEDCHNTFTKHFD